MKLVLLVNNFPLASLLLLGIQAILQPPKRASKAECAPNAQPFRLSSWAIASGQQIEGGDSAPLPRSAETPRESCVQLWSPRHRTELELWERGQRRPQQ